MANIQIGVVLSLQGQASLTHANGTVEKLKEGSQIFLNDVVTTGKNGAVLISLLDGSEFEIGSAFTATLNTDVFDPAGYMVAGETIGQPFTVSHIGEVTGVDGNVKVVRADGTSHTLTVGDFLYANDVVITAADSSTVAKMLDGSDMDIGPDFTAYMNDDLFPSRYPDYVRAGLSDAEIIRAAILAGQDPADVGKAPAAGGEVTEDAGHSVVVIEDRGRQVTPESGHETTGLSYGFSAMEELLQTQQELPTISIATQNNIGDVAIEGEPLVFNVNLDSPNFANDVTATWTVTLGSADESDFPENSVFTGTITIPAGQTSGTIEIPTLDDALFEGGAGTFEDLTVTLSDVQNANSGTTTATGLIEDNDTTEVGFKPGADGTDVTVTEGDPGGPDATITFTLELTNPSDSAVSVDYTVVPGSAVSPDDYNGSLDGLSGTVTFAAGSQSATITLDVTDDLLVEGTESFTVQLSNAQGADLGPNTTATGTILDNDTTEVGFKPGADGTDVTVTEGDPGGVDATITFTLELTNPSDSAVSVDYTVVPGSAVSPDDYNGSLDGLSGTVTFAAGSQSATITLDVTDDLLVEGTESFTVQLSNAQGADLGPNTTATGTILDNDTTEVGFKPGADGTDVTVTEGDPGGVDATITFTLELTNPSDSAVSVDYTVVPGSAVSPDDYNGSLDGLSGTVTFAAGSQSATITLDVTDDLLVEGTESFTVQLSNAQGADLGPNTTATGTILDNDTTEVGFKPGADGTDVTVTEGDPGGVDATITFTLELTNPSDSAVSVDYTVVPGSAVSPDDYNGSLDGLSGTVTFAAGSQSATITLDVTDDLLVEGTESFTVQLSNAQGADLGPNTTATGTILDNDTTEVGFKPGADGTDVTVTEGDPGGVDATITFTLELTNPSDSAVSVDYTVVPGSAVSPDDYNGSLDGLSGTVTFAAGSQSATITLDVTDDLLVEGTESFTVQLSNAQGADLGPNTTATGTILDNDTTEVGFKPGADGTDVTVTEGDPGGVDATITFTLELTNPSDSAVSVDYTVVPGSAVSPDDYNGSLDGLSGTVTFAAGSQSATITLDVTDDLLVEGTESFTVQLSNAQGADLGPNTTATGTILDNDTTEVGFKPGADGTDVTVTEGDPGGVDATITFTLELTNPSDSAVSVDYTVVPGSAVSPDDYNGSLDGLSGTVTFAAGSQSATITLDVTDDLLVEGTESFTVQLSNAQGADLGPNTTATGTILDNDSFIVDHLRGQVTEAALNDGPGGDDDGTQDDPAQPAVNTISNGTLIFVGGDLSGINYISGPGGDAVDNSTGTQFILDATDGSWKLTVDKDDGNYQFTLLDNVAHPQGDNLTFDQGILPLTFSYTVTAPGGSDIGSLVVDIRDDGPRISIESVTVADTLNVDETDLGTDAAASYADNFSAAIEYGADGPGSTVYSLALSSTAVGSGLYAIDNTQPMGKGDEILLSQVGNVITGSASGEDYFTITVNPITGAVSFDQLKAVWHQDSDNPDDVSMLETVAASDLVLTVTVTDADGDSVSHAIDLGQSVFSINDDAPIADTPDSGVLGIEAGNTLTKNLNFVTLGADGPASPTAYSLTGLTQGDLVTGTVSGEPHQLTSLGVNLLWYDNGDGSWSAVTDLGDAANTTVMTAVVNSDGTYTVSLDDTNPLDGAGSTFGIVLGSGVKGGNTDDVALFDVPTSDPDADGDNIPDTAEHMLFVRAYDENGVIDTVNASSNGLGVGMAQSIDNDPGTDPSEELHIYFSEPTTDPTSVNDPKADLILESIDYAAFTLNKLDAGETGHWQAFFVDGAGNQTSVGSGDIAGKGIGAGADSDVIFVIDTNTANDGTNEGGTVTGNFNLVVFTADDGTGYRITSISGLDTEPGLGITVNLEATATDADGDAASANFDVSFFGLFVEPLPALIVGTNADDQGPDDGVDTHLVNDNTSTRSGDINGPEGTDILVGDAGGTLVTGTYANIILILDTSGSMDDYTVEFTDGDGITSNILRIDALKLAVNSLLDGLAGSTADEVRVHIIEFKDNGSSLGTFDIKSGDLQIAKDAVNGLRAGGWTNYEDALQKAIDWSGNTANLLDNPGGTLNVVNQTFFISDGMPTAYTRTNGTIATNVSASVAMSQVTGTDNSGSQQDTSNEVQILEDQFGPIEAVGIALTSASDIDNLNEMEGAPRNSSPDVADNIFTANQLIDVLQDLNPLTDLSSLGDDTINGGAGNDFIFGDSVFTDTLADAEDLATDDASGWQVFTELEAGLGTTSDWDREDTINYIRDNHPELAAESELDGEGREGGNDIIDAGAGNDTVYGQEGDDSITGGSGNDTLSGGTGSDTFIWQADEIGTDTVMDFNAGEGDVLNLADLLDVGGLGGSDLAEAYLKISSDGSDTTIEAFSGGDGATAPSADQTIILSGVDLTGLGSDTAGIIDSLLGSNNLVVE